VAIYTPADTIKRLSWATKTKVRWAVSTGLTG